MGFARDLLLHAIWPAFELTLHGLTPLALVSALTFGNITLSFLIGTNIQRTYTNGPKNNLRDAVLLWGMGSVSILIWAACVIMLHNAGLS